MFTQERQQLILTMLSEEGRITVTELAERLSVSDDTVRRDLNALSEHGFLQKVHGGAVTLDVPGMARLARTQILPKLKAKLGAKVASTIESGQTIILDAGATTLEVARCLQSSALTVITNSLDIAQCLSNRPSIKLILAGGEWDERQRLFSGQATLEVLNHYRADVAILGACAVDEHMGLTATGEKDAAVKRAIVSISKKKIVVADHTKFDRHEAYFVAKLEELDEIYTDRPVTFKKALPVVHVVGETDE